MGGQRLSAGLPWYRVRLGEAVEPEGRALDCHSGFGVRDRLWFPVAHTREPIDHISELQALKSTYEQAHSHHAYIIKPKARST